jgi:hypothetical protein
MNFVYLRSSRLHIFKLEHGFMHWQQGGERKVEKSCIASLQHIPWVKGELVHFFCIGLLGGVVCCTKSVWLILVTGLIFFGGIGLTGFGNRPDRFVPRVGTCSGGACIRAGGVLVFFGGLCYFLEHSFVSDVSSRCPCLGGRDLSSSSDLALCLSLAFDRLLEFLFVCFFSFSFSLITKCVCCQCTHQGGDWLPCVVRGPVDGRFLVWWVIENVVWTESWLSIAGAGCSLTRVSAGEEQAWKVIAGEASRCAEDK